MNLNKLSSLFHLRPKNIKLFARENLVQRSLLQCRPIVTIQPSSTPYECQTFSRPQHFVITKRFKKSAKKFKGENASEETEAGEDDDDDDELAEENPLLVDDLLGSTPDGSQKVVIDVSSLRLDAFSKTAFNTTRAKIEEAFYKGELYLNGERPPKKSTDLSINDEIDLVLKINADDRNMLDIKRVQIIGLPDKATEQGRMKVTINRWNSLTIKAHDSVDS